MPEIKELGAIEVVLLLVPVAVVIALSAAMRLGQAGRITIAAARSIVQLLAVGIIIGWVFHQDKWYWITSLLAVMTLVAGFTAAGQLGRWFAGMSWLLSLVLGAVTAAALLYLGKAVIGVEEWDARYLIPLGGMLLGNAMTAATLTVERLTGEIRQSRAAVEAYLALGASPRQAVQPMLRRAITAGMTPTVNAMMIVGVVKLPGMMTGQMLGGTEPMQAALYQLLILVGILFGDMLAATLCAVLLYRRFFTHAWQLDQTVLQKAK